MTKRLSYSCIILLFAVCATNANAQEEDSLVRANPRSARIKLTVRTDNDSAVLRWAPTRPGGWKIANKLGYIVERVKVGDSGEFDKKDYKKLSSSPIKPWTLNEWKNRFPTKNNFAGIAAQCLYGKAFTPPVAEQASVNELKYAAEELDNRFSFALFAADNDGVVANGLGLRLVDKNIKNGEKYIYRVYVSGKDTTYSFDTAYSFVTVEKFPQPTAPENLTVKPGDGSLILEWDENPISPYTGYYVYRSDDGGKNFTLMTESPLINATPPGAKERNKPRYTDTTITNYKIYIYRVIGVNAFADRSAPAAIETFGRDMTPPPPPTILPTEQLGKNRVKIKWEMKETSPDFVGFMIGRSDNSVMGFINVTTKPLPLSSREFIDDSASEDLPYYLVVSVDTAGNGAPSLPIMASVVDTMPPHIPAGLAGTIDTNGIVRLHWTLSAEKKVRGYRVLWANDPSHEFTQKSNYVIEDTSFVDTVNTETLTQYIYYKIAAVDKRFNHSPMTQMIALRRPDKIAPEASVFTDVRNSERAVLFQWEPSRSEDVREQALLRRPEGEKQWTRIASLRKEIRQYADSSVEQNVIYHYTFDVSDSSGNHTKPSASVQGRAYDSGVRGKVRGLIVTYDEKSGHTQLKWNYDPAKKEKYWFVIYRAKDKNDLVQFKSIAGDARGFEDNSLYGKGEYSYAIRVMSENGGDSGLSEKVSVMVR